MTETARSCIVARKPSAPSCFDEAATALPRNPPRQVDAREHQAARAARRGVQAQSRPQRILDAPSIRLGYDRLSVSRLGSRPAHRQLSPPEGRSKYSNVPQRAIALTVPFLSANPRPFVPASRVIPREHQAHLSAEPPGAETPARIPRPHGHRGRPESAGAPPRQGSQAPFGLNVAGRQVGFS